MEKESRRSFLSKSFLIGAGSTVMGGLTHHAWTKPVIISGSSKTPGDWLRRARVFRLDGYQFPLDPNIEYDAAHVVKVMEEMGLNVCRIASMGKYSYMQGVRFSLHPELGNRDLVAETIRACKPRGIKVLPYISTGNRLAVTMLTLDYPQYAQAETPGGGPKVMEVPGEARANVCWNTPYREAFLDLIHRLVDNYDIDGLYFDAWINPWYHYSAPHTCYCKGCTGGFRNATGMEIPYHPELKDYTPDERMVVRRYLYWKWERMIDVFLEVRRIADRRGLPMITNVNSLWRLEHKMMEPRMWENLDAVMYESIDNMLERWESLSGAAAQGKPIWPYVSSYNESPLAGSDNNEKLRTRQHIFSDAILGGGQVITNQKLIQSDAIRTPISESNSMLERNRKYFEEFENVPYAAVVYQFESRGRYAIISGAFGPAEDDQREGHNMRVSTQGAYSTLLSSHTQVTSILQGITEMPQRIGRYKLLYLADIPFLTSKQIDGIKSYVFGGGGLVASGETSLYGMQYHESGLYGRSLNRLSRFMLEELFRVRPVEQEQQLKLLMAEGADIRISIPEWGLDLQSYTNPAVNNLPVQPVEFLEGAEEIGYFYTFNMGEVQKLQPAVVRSSYGKGKVIYLAAALEPLALENSGGPQRRLILWAADKVTGELSPYRIDADPALYTNLTRRGSTMVLHLLNSREPQDKEGYDEGWIEPIKPVSGSICFPKGEKIKSVHTLNGSKLFWKESGNIIVFELPRLDLYEAIILKLA